MTKIIKKRVNKECAICGKEISVIIYSDKSYRGGHFFGKVPLHTKKAFRDAMKAGYREVNMAGRVVRVMKKDPIVYKYLEYWECPKCYWQK